jgi:hypothetical protein
LPLANNMPVKRSTGGGGRDRGVRIDRPGRRRMARTRRGKRGD